MVVTREEEQKKGESKGFAGLSSLVSDVDTTTPLPTPKKEPAAAASSAGQPAQPQPNQHRQTYQKSAQPSSRGSSGGEWLLGIAAVIVVLLLIGPPNENTISPAPAYSPPAQSTAPSYSPPAPAPAPAPALPQSQSQSQPQPQPQARSRPTESKPPVGQDLVFSREQIRYCLAEDIRMDAAKSALNNYSDYDVDRFNAMVADYNSRCGSFRYRSGALEGAGREIEPYRSQLQSEGRSRFARSSTGSHSTPAPARPALDAMVQAIQRKLNELGYEAGTADGLMGRRTRSAIIAFQQDRGLAATGVADQALLLQLQRAPSRQAVAVTNPSTRASTPAPQPQRSQSNGIPDFSMVNASEQASIENACGYLKRSSGPAAYYQCQQTQLVKLANSGGQPDLSRISPTESASIENACGYLKRSSGPADYYQCQRTQVAKLANSGGQPDLSRISASERTSIENACGYLKRSSGPADYYQCMRTELGKLR